MAATAAARTPSPTPCLADLLDEQQSVYTLLKVSTCVDSETGQSQMWSNEKRSVM